MRTPQWLKKLAGYAGMCYVAAELSERGIVAAPLLENFPDADIMIAKKNSDLLGWVEVKSFHPDRADSWMLGSPPHGAADWVNARENEFVVFVVLGSEETGGHPRYFIAKKTAVGRICKAEREEDWSQWRFALPEDKRSNHLHLRKGWENHWSLFNRYRATIAE